MFECNLEPWEKLPENFDTIKAVVQAGCFPLMPREPEIGKCYRLYPQGCISGNGTAYHGNLRIGKNPKKLIIFFNGGGVGFDEYTISRPSNAFTGHIEDTYYSNDGEWIGDYFLHTGLNAKRDDNPFLDWSMIHILYCNGDFHSGDGDFPYTAQDGSRREMPCHGYRNAMAVIRQAKKYLPEPEQILIAGSSAGGFGVSLLAEDIIGQFPDCGDITCLVDSSLLVKADWQRVARKVWHSPAHIWKRLTGENLVLDSCRALKQAYGDRVRVLFLCSVRDALLTVAQNALDGKGQTFDRASGIRFQKRLKEMCSQLTESIPEVGLYIFTGPMDAPGYDDDCLTLHCALNNPYLFDYQEEGKTICQWILEAMDGSVQRLGLSLLEELPEERKEKEGAEA